MLKKIPISNDSYAFENFISEDERNNLKRWVLALIDNNELCAQGDPDGLGYGRFFASVSNIRSKVPDVFFTVKRRIMVEENLRDEYCDHFLNDFVSVNLPGASIHRHIDENKRNCIHTRYNLIVNKAEDGGYPVYGNSIIDYENRMLWRCQAGRFYHESTPVTGAQPRINISYGYQIPLSGCTAII